MQCSAICADWHPCRGYATLSPIGIPLCHMHHDFTAPETLFRIVERNAALPHTQEEYDWCVRALRSRAFRVPAIRDALRAYAIDRLKDMFANKWTERDKATYIFRMFLLAGILVPIDIRPLWRHGLLRQLRVIQFCMSQGTAITPEYIDEIIALLSPFVKGASAKFVLPYLISLMGSAHFDATTGVEAAVAIQMWKKVITFAVGDVNMRPFAGINLQQYLEPIIEFHRKELPDSWGLNAELQAHIYAELRRSQEIEKQKILDRMRPLKELIAAAAWRTDRLFTALEAGMEIEEL
jgi:hypothetical protein